jgi:hypothetical protein
MRRRRAAIVGAVGVLLLALALVGAKQLLSRRPASIAHQRPYAWDAYTFPERKYAGQPIGDVVNFVNSAVRDASGGKVSQAIFLEAGPTQVNAVGSDVRIGEDMARMIAAFAEHERDAVRRERGGFRCSNW